MKIVSSPQADTYSFILALSCETKTSLIIKVLCLCIFILPRCSGSTVIGNSLGKQYLLTILGFPWPRLFDNLSLNGIVSFLDAPLIHLTCSLVNGFFKLPDKSPEAFPLLGGEDCAWHSNLYLLNIQSELTAPLSFRPNTQIKLPKPVCISSLVPQSIFSQLFSK